MPRKDVPACVSEKSIFADRLTKAMKERGENQTTLAEKITAQYLTIQRQTISLYMNGQSKPDTERLTAIAKVLDVSADWLLGLSNAQSNDGELQQAYNYTGLSEDAVKFLRYIGHDPETPEGDIMPIVLSFLLEDYEFFRVLSSLSVACSLAPRYKKPDTDSIDIFINLHREELRKMGAEVWPTDSTSDMLIAQANTRFLNCMEKVRLRFMTQS